MNIYAIILLITIINIVPIVRINYKEIVTNKLLTVVWSVIATIIDVLIVRYLFKVPEYTIHIIIASIIAGIFNYFIITKDINIKKVPKSFFVFAFFFLSVFLQFIPILLFNLDINNINAEQQLYLTTFSDSISLLILIIIYFKELKIDFKKIKGNFFKMMDTGIKYWILGAVVMFISNVIIMIFFNNANAVNEEGVQELIHSSRFLSIFTIGIIAPIIEELTFRKAFRDIFKNDFAFVLISGLTFGALHVVLSLSSPWDLLYIIPYSSLGIAFAKAYQKTDNIFTSIILHTIHNTVLTTISVLGIGVILL